MKGQGGGGTAKGGGKVRSGGGSVVIKTTTVKKDKKCKQIEENGHLLLLRAALFEDSGKDKDVTAGLAKAFMRFDRNGLDLNIEFCTILANSRDISACFELCKDRMEDVYDASGYGWDDDDKMRELTEPGARFLLVREWPIEGSNNDLGELVGFVHFRFTVLGEVIDSMAGLPCLHVYDIHLEQDVRRKGLGRHLMSVLELVARREKMALLSLSVQLGDSATEQWVLKGLRGFQEDHSLAEHGFDADMEGFRVYSKTFPVNPTINNQKNVASIVAAVAPESTNHSLPATAAPPISLPIPPDSVSSASPMPPVPAAVHTNIDNNAITSQNLQSESGECRVADSKSDSHSDIDDSTAPPSLSTSESATRSGSLPLPAADSEGLDCSFNSDGSSDGEGWVKV